VFRRRRRERERAAPAAEETPVPQREHGPWDADEPHPERERVDLGGLQLPIGPGFEVQLNVAGDQIVGAVILADGSALQVHAFAAPKSTGIWDEVRADLKREVTTGGGTAEEVEGPFGVELAAQVKQGDAVHPVRFCGIDGPRWFLRAVFSGKAAIDADAARPLEDVVRDIVVVRGDAPMPPKEPIELRLPPEARHAMEQQQQAAAQNRRPDLDPFHRGPEITETR
jgi:Protein of unknown function (DUF3710).